MWAYGEDRPGGSSSGLFGPTGRHIYQLPWHHESETCRQVLVAEPDLQQVPTTETAPVEGVHDYLPTFREMATGDRDVYEKAKLAFVSYVRSYKEHQVS